MYSTYNNELKLKANYITQKSSFFKMFYFTQTIIYLFSVHLNTICNHLCTYPFKYKQIMRKKK